MISIYLMRNILTFIIGLKMTHSCTEVGEVLSISRMCVTYKNTSYLHHRQGRIMTFLGLYANELKGPLRRSHPIIRALPS